MLGEQGGMPERTGQHSKALIWRRVLPKGWGMKAERSRGRLPYSTNMSEQLRMAVVKVNATVGKSPTPCHLRVSHSTQAQVVKKVKGSQKESEYQNSESLAGRLCQEWAYTECERLKVNTSQGRRKECQLSLGAGSRYLRMSEQQLQG